MRVQLLVSRAGVNFANNCGDVIDVSDAEGKSLIEAGQAIPHVVEVKPERRKNVDKGKSHAKAK